MQYKSIFIVLILGVIAALQSCGGGKEAVCDSGLKIQVRSNSPVGSNQTLTFTTFGVGEGKNYIWTGPNGYTSHDKEPAVSNPARGKDQTYTVTIETNGGCTYTGSSIVTVTGPTNNCGLDSNNAKLQGIATMTFNKVTGTPGVNDYIVQAMSPSASVTIEFPNNQPPAEGVYNVQGSTAALPAGYARVTFKAIAPSPWLTSGGQVYVSIDGEVTTVSFCELTFSSDGYAGSVKGGANIIWAP